MRYVILIVVLLVCTQEINAQYSCNTSFIGGCGTTDTIPLDAIVIIDTAVQPNQTGCYFICYNAYLKLLDNPNEIGINNIFLEPGATFADNSITSSVENNIVAKSPSTINLSFEPMSIKCDSGVSVFLNGQPMNPYPCSCNSIGFDYTYIESCVVGIQDIFNKDMRIFPNPTTDMITIELSSGIKQVSISDTYGVFYKRNIKTIQPSVEVVVSLAGLPKGVYFIQVIDEADYSITDKIFLQ